MVEFPGIPYAGPAMARYGNYAKRYMVIHCTSNNASPADECAFARRRTDGVGLHFASDPTTVLQCLESWYGTGHVGSTVGNRYGISWEFTGYVSWPTTYWQACIDRAAPSMARVMAKWGIPHRWLTDQELRNGVAKGLVTHLQCSRVLGGSTHVDPGPNFPQQYLVEALGGSTVSLTGEQHQMLTNLHDWMFDYCRGLVAPDPGTPHIAEYVPNRLLSELHARPPVEPAPVDAAALAEALAANTAFVGALADAVAARMPTRDERVQEAREGAELAEDS